MHNDFFCLRKSTYSCAWAVLTGIDVNCVHFLRLKIKASKANENISPFVFLTDCFFNLVADT